MWYNKILRDNVETFTFNTKCWSLRWLSYTSKHIFLELGSKCLTKTNCCCTLAFTEWSWGYTEIGILTFTETAYCLFFGITTLTGYQF